MGFRAFYFQSLENLQFNNQTTGYSAKIKYWGADHSKNQQPTEPSRWQTNIKIDIILYEKMVFVPESATVFHLYSDKLTENAQNIPIYSISEVLAEKIRALIQRSYTAPRDAKRWGVKNVLIMLKNVRSFLSR